MINYQSSLLSRFNSKWRYNWSLTSARYFTTDCKLPSASLLITGWPLTTHYQIPWLFQAFQVNIYGVSTLATVAIQTKCMLFLTAILRIYIRDLRIGCLRSNWTSNRIGRYDSNRIGHIYRSTLVTCESAVSVRIEYESNQKMWGTPDSSFQSSNTLNNTGVWSLTELASLYSVPLSTVIGLSRLTRTSNGQARPIQKLSNQPRTVYSNRISKLRRSLSYILS